MLERPRTSNDSCYAKWDNFLNALEKAKKACEGAGERVQDHFADVGKMVEIGSTLNVELTISPSRATPAT